MWYEILPSATIIAVVLAVPIYASWGLNKMVVNNGYRRFMDERFERAMYTRDCRLTGNPYVQNGLDAIPDEK